MGVYSFGEFGHKAWPIQLSASLALGWRIGDRYYARLQNGMQVPYLTGLAKAIGVVLAIWLLGRAITAAHPLDRSSKLLRWSMVTISAGLYVLSFRLRISDRLVWASVFAFTLFFFLPDLSYYLVLGVRTLARRLCRREVDSSSPQL